MLLQVSTGRVIMTSSSPIIAQSRPVTSVNIWLVAFWTSLKRRNLTWSVITIFSSSFITLCFMHMCCVQSEVLLNTSVVQSFTLCHRDFFAPDGQCCRTKEGWKTLFFHTVLLWQGYFDIFNFIQMSMHLDKPATQNLEQETSISAGRHLNINRVQIKMCGISPKYEWVFQVVATFVLVIWFSYGPCPHVHGFLLFFIFF